MGVASAGKTKVAEAKESHILPKSIKMFLLLTVVAIEVDTKEEIWSI